MYLEICRSFLRLFKKNLQSEYSLFIYEIHEILPLEKTLTIKARSVQSLRKETVFSPIFFILTVVNRHVKIRKNVLRPVKWDDSIKSQFFGLLSHVSNLGIMTFRDCVFSRQILSISSHLSRLVNANMRANMCANIFIRSTFQIKARL